MYLKIAKTLPGVMAGREHFLSSAGFLAAALSGAIGLGNIWGFPSQAAQNGGIAYVLIYIVMGLMLAWPLLAMELAIGRYKNSDSYSAITGLGSSRFWKILSVPAGILTLVLVITATTLYSIVGGWVVDHAFKLVSRLAFGKNIWPEGLYLSAELFLLSVLCVSYAGIQQGIERWCRNVLPAMLILLIGLIGYVSLQDGAAEGFRKYLYLDWQRALDRTVMLSALGQVFFSLSLGGMGMLVYGSYLQQKSNIPRDSFLIVVGDAGFSFLAGLAIVPAIFVAGHYGVQGAVNHPELLQGPGLVFDIIPVMLEQLGEVGQVFCLLFFLLVFFAALTSAVSMLEVPVAFLRNRGFLRSHAVILSTVIVGGLIVPAHAYLELSFSVILPFCQQYIQPLCGLMVCILAGWAWQRGRLLKGLRGDQKSGWHRWLALYIQYVCPVLLLVVFINLW